jgi:hypothetical protein
VRKIGTRYVENEQKRLKETGINIDLLTGTPRSVDIEQNELHRGPEPPYAKKL